MTRHSTDAMPTFIDAIRRPCDPPADTALGMELDNAAVISRPRKPESAWWIDEDWAPLEDGPAELDPIRAFVALLRGPTGDGQAKRDAGLKVHWTIDAGHYDAMNRHLYRYEMGERYDDESGSHALVHCAWRALALAYIEMVEDGRIR